MGGKSAPALTFDAGALLAIERGDRNAVGLARTAAREGRAIAVPAAALAQAWRGGGPRQARLSSFLNSQSVAVHAFDRRTALASGELCARTATRDVVDASVVITAWDNGRVVVTSDPDDLLRLDPGLTVIEV